MGILLIIIYLLFKCVPVKCIADGGKMFLQDHSMSGYTCNEDEVIFKRNLREIPCARMCLNNRTCLSISYDPDQQQCAGCASLIGVHDVTQDRSTFYKRNIKAKYIGCFIDCPRILGEKMKTSSSMTAEFCISHCISKAKTYAMTEHFPEGGPSDQFPDPYMVDSSAKYTPCRAPPKRRPMSEPPKKRRKILSEVSTFTDENCMSSPLVVTDSNLTDLQKPETSDYSQYRSPEPQISPLDMLALAAENMDMKRKMAEQAFENQQLKIEMYKQHQTMADHIRENENLRIEIAKTKQSVNVNSEKPVSKKYGFNVEYVRDSQVRDNFKYYTGFTYEQFMNIFRFLVPFSGESPLTFPRTITSVKKIRLQDQLLLALVKLRLNFEFKHIANLFEISPQDAGAIFRGWINYMYYRFGSVSIWPDREVLIQHMPAKFKEDFPTTFVILDGTELKVERPSSLRSQSQCYSDYKSATTLKGLVGIDPRGSFTFISMLFSGSISDKEITKQSGLLSLLKQLLDCGKLKPGDGVMVDKGFLICEEIEALGLKLFMPPFAPGAGQMSAGDVKLTKKLQHIAFMLNEQFLDQRNLRLLTTE